MPDRLEMALIEMAKTRIQSNVPRDVAEIAFGVMDLTPSLVRSILAQARLNGEPVSHWNLSPQAMDSWENNALLVHRVDSPIPARHETIAGIPCRVDQNMKAGTAALIGKNGQILKYIEGIGL